MNIGKFALLLVVFVDVLGQGLMFPIVNTLMLDPSVGFLPADLSVAAREVNYGIVVGVFFLAWFLGAAYISRLSDMIGRKAGIQICLFGSLIGYFITILSLYENSLWMLIAGRAITGFTAGNQPIAQAAMIDLSQNDREKTRNMGFIVASFSLSLVAGPLLGGLLADKSVLGDLASLQLPFYVAAALVCVTIVLIAVFFREARHERSPLRFEPAEIFLLMWRIGQRPVVLRISLAFFFFMLASNSFVIFMDNYLTGRFQFGVFGNSMAWVAFGAILAVTSSFLVSWFGARFTRGQIVSTAAIGYALSILLFIVAPVPAIAFIAIVLFGFAFAINYPTLLSIFSASVGEEEQGWVMGVTTALFTLGAGIISLLGGRLMGIGIDLPFLVAIGSALLALLLIGMCWRGAEVRRITSAKAE